MKKRLFCASAALLLACIMPMQAGAVEIAAGAAQTKPPPAAQDTVPKPEETEVLYPVDVQISPDGLTCKKIYDVPKTLSPDIIPQDDFERGGLHYTFQDMLRIEMPDIDRRMHSESVTVSSSSDNSNDVMALLPKSKIVVTEDGYTGTAYLDVSSISTKVAGRESVSRNLTATREYPDLRDMDMTNIPKTIKENGNTLTFENIEWKSSSEETDNMGTTETLYTAVVTYTRSATSSRTTGYTVTATYAGEVSHRNNESMRYIVVYAGSPVVEEPEAPILPPNIEDVTASEPASELEQNEDLMPWVICLTLGVIVVLLAFRPPSCRKMVERMQTMAAQARDKAQQNKKEKEMQNSAKQGQKQEDDEQLREEPQIFGPLEKVKAYMRSRRQRKAEKKQAMLALAAPQSDENEEWWEDEPVNGAETSEAYTDDQNEETVDSSPSQQTDEGSAKYDDGADYDDDDEYPSISD